MYSKELFEAIAGTGKHAYSIPKPTKKGLVDKRSLRTAKKGTSVKKGDKKAGSKVPDKERTFKLMKVWDIRPFDLDTGKRVPLIRGDGNLCDRCGREHAVIWQVQETTPGQQRLWNVGSGCGPKILDGWSPEKPVIAKAKKRSNIEAKARAVIKKIKEALEIGKSYKFKNPTTSLEKLYDEEINPKWDFYYYKGMNWYNGIKVEHGKKLTKDDLELLKLKWVYHDINEKYGFRTIYTALQGYEGKNFSNMNFEAPHIDVYWYRLLSDYKKIGGNIKEL